MFTCTPSEPAYRAALPVAIVAASTNPIPIACMSPLTVIAPSARLVLQADHLHDRTMATARFTILTLSQVPPSLPRH
jgi:hypothetical protein